MLLDRAVIVVALVLVACGGRERPLPILEATTSRAVMNGDDPTKVAPDAVSTPALGARDPLVVVTLWVDYQCPFCKRQHDVAARVLDFWGDRVQVQFRQVPIAGHALARPAALAALAAHRQERFACMNSALIRTRPSWTRLAGADAFFTFVREHLVPHCGLSAEALMRDVDDPRLAAKVEADWQLAGALDVPGTPSVQVDGLFAKFWPNPGVRPAMLLSSIVRRGIREAEAACERGCDRNALLAERIFGNLGDVELTMRLIDGQ